MLDDNLALTLSSAQQFLLWRRCSCSKRLFTSDADGTRRAHTDVGVCCVAFGTGVLLGVCKLAASEFFVLT